MQFLQTTWVIETALFWVRILKPHEEQTWNSGFDTWVQLKTHHNIWEFEMDIHLSLGQISLASDDMITIQIFWTLSCFWVAWPSLLMLSTVLSGCRTWRAGQVQVQPSVTTDSRPRSGSQYWYFWLVPGIRFHSFYLQFWHTRPEYGSATSTLISGLVLSSLLSRTNPVPFPRQRVLVADQQLCWGGVPGTTGSVSLA